MEACERSVHEEAEEVEGLLLSKGGVAFCE